MVLNCSVGPAVPAREGVSLGIELPALLEERPGPEEHLPAEEGTEGQKQGSTHTSQVMAVALSILRKSSRVSASVPGIVNTLVHQVSQLHQGKNYPQTLFLLAQQFRCIPSEVHFFDHRPQLPTAL